MSVFLEIFLEKFACPLYFWTFYCWELTFFFLDAPVTIQFFRSPYIINFLASPRTDIPQELCAIGVKNGQVRTKESMMTSFLRAVLGFIYILGEFFSWKKLESLLIPPTLAERIPYELFKLIDFWVEVVTTRIKKSLSFTTRVLKIAVALVEIVYLHTT